MNSKPVDGAVDGGGMVDGAVDGQGVCLRVGD